MDYILIFNNTHNALSCEKILNEMNISMTILPNPSHISGSCGISIGINKIDFDEVKKIINKQINVKSIYDIKNNLIIDNK